MQIRRLAVRLRWIAPDKTELVELRSFAHDDSESARNNLDVEWAFIFQANLFKLDAIVCDQAGEYIQSPRGALGIGAGRGVLWEIELFLERDNIDASSFKHCRLA